MLDIHYKIEEKELKKALFFVWVSCMMALLSAGCTSGNTPGTPGQSIYSDAVNKEAAGAYFTANALYQQALPLLRQEGNAALTRQARMGWKRTYIIMSDFSKTGEQVQNALFNSLTITDGQINFVLSRLIYLDIEQRRYYFSDFGETALHLDLALLMQAPAVLARNRLGYSVLEPFINPPGPPSGSPYINPITYQATATYNVPRSALPTTGLLKIWQAAPVMTDCQTEVAMISVTPAGYVKNPATLTGDLGDIYLEVPLAALAGNLQIEIKFQFKHYEQRFTMVNPANIGIYDTSSALYREYTASGKNIFINAAITAKAYEIVGWEQNPYRAARKIYNHVVNNLSYSHIPHASLESLGIPESVFVHEHAYGDCGAQSIYFAALCRAVGIPARATGGYQLFPGMEGTHFWAEIYLPNYGWIPVDTSVGQISNYIPDLSAAQKQAFQDYFFGSMDPYRMVIQKDVDLPFSPPAPEPTSLSTTLQLPVALCDEMDGSPDEAIWPYYRIQFTRLP